MTRSSGAAVISISLALATSTTRPFVKKPWMHRSTSMTNNPNSGNNSWLQILSRTGEALSIQLYIIQHMLQSIWPRRTSNLLLKQSAGPLLDQPQSTRIDTYVSKAKTGVNIRAAPEIENIVTPGTGHSVTSRLSTVKRCLTLQDQLNSTRI